MRKSPVYLLLLLLPVSAQGSECLHYEPANTKVTGVVVQKTFPGAPNYEDIAKGDKPETVWLLQLPQAVCVEKGKDSLDEGEKDVTSLQLVLNSDLSRKIKDLLGKTVSVSGTLFHAHTGHHHTKVLLTASAIRQ